MALDQATVNSAGLGQQFDRRIFDLEGKSAAQAGDVADFQQQESDLSASRAQRARDAAAELKPASDKLKEAAHKAADEPIQKEERMDPFQRPALDPQELQKTFGMLLVASMFAGKASRSPYNNTMTALTGAMNGFMKEDDHQVAQSLAIYDTNLAAMKERNAALQRDMAANDRKNKINVAAWTLEHDLILERYDFDDKAAGHEQKSLSDKVKRGESILNSTEKAIDRLTVARAQMQDHREAREARDNEARLRREQSAENFRELMDFRREHATTSGAGASIVPEEHRDLHGDAYLATLPSGIAGTVKALSEGRETFSSLGYRGADRQAMVQRVNQYNPTFEQGMQAGRAGVIKDFKSGQQSRNIIAINQALAHMGTLDELGAAMKNKDTQIVNRVLNRLATELGDPRINNFELATQAVGDELMRTFRQVGASETEALAFQKKFQSAGSPAQIREALQTGAKLLSGRIKAVNNSWKRGMQVDTDYPGLIDPEPADVLKRFGVDALGGAAAPSPRAADADLINKWLKK
jgi:hypothetical protein